MLLVCPVCTVAVVAGLEISRLLGVDDTVVAVWIGGLILSSSFWTASWISKRESIKKYAKMLPITVLMYLLFLVPLYLSHVIGIERNTLWGIDKIILGTILGSVAFIGGYLLDKYQRMKMGKQLFDFQKVILPISFLFFASFALYLITK
jgi:hypothetical protein